MGIRPLELSERWGQASQGVFVIDRATLGVVQHWAPTANDATVAVLADGRVAVIGQPGLNAAGDEVPWEGSITLHDGVDGRILTRYGRVSVDMPPVVVRR